jgi:hypothetical protein
MNRLRPIAQYLALILAATIGLATLQVVAVAVDSMLAEPQVHVRGAT